MYYIGSGKLVIVIVTGKTLIYLVGRTCVPDTVTTSAMITLCPCCGRPPLFAGTTSPKEPLLCLPGAMYVTPMPWACQSLKYSFVKNLHALHCLTTKKVNGTTQPPCTAIMAMINRGKKLLLSQE